MDRLNALRGTPSPSATAPSPTTSQKDAAEANDFFAALAGGADNITSRRRAPAKAAAPVEKTPARSFVALPSPSTSQKDDQEAQDFFSTLLQGSQPTPAATPAARPAPPPTPMSISPPPPQQTQQQRRVSFREPVDAPPPPLPRTVSDDAETPPKETDDVLKLVDSWGADASPDDEAARLAMLRADEERRRASEAQAESARKVALEEAAARAEAEVSGLRRISSNSPEEGSRLTERRRARREATVWSAGGSSSSDADVATTPAPTAPKRTDSAEARDFFAALGAPVAAEPAASPAPEAAPVEPEAPEAESDEFAEPPGPGLEDGALLEPVSSDLLAARPGAVFGRAPLMFGCLIGMRRDSTAAITMLDALAACATPRKWRAGRLRAAYDPALTSLFALLGGLSMVLIIWFWRKNHRRLARINWLVHYRY